MSAKWPWALAFILVVNGIGALIGMNFTPGAWFDALQKPWFQPPDSLFAPVWTLLYVIIGYVGWRVFVLLNLPELRRLWLVQMALNFAWSPVFFGLHWPSVALVIIGGLWVTLVLFMLRARHSDPQSALLFVPYLAWITFATLLNAAIWHLNPGI